MKFELTDAGAVRKLAGLAVDNRTTPQKLAAVLLAKALEDAPEPQAHVNVTATTTRVTATQRHGDEVLAVLLDRPDGLTYHEIRALFGWSKPTTLEIMRYLRGEGMVAEDYRRAANGAPALVFRLPTQST